MASTSRAHRPTPRTISTPGGALAQTRENQDAIRSSMKRWRVHNHYGRSIGRGLTDDELVNKVAGETGASKALVRLSLKQGN